MVHGALWLALWAGFATGEEPTLRWQERDVTVAEIPASLGGNAQATASTWAGFAAEHGYHMFLEEQGRVLLLMPEKQRATKELELIQKTIEAFERLVPVPVEKPSTEPASAPRASDEGPNAVPTGRTEGSPRGESGWSYTYTWGDAAWSRDAETAVLLAAANEDDYFAALDFLGARHDYLQGWLSQARKFAGCSLEEPLIAIWLLEGAGLEEWSPQNELVHRLTTQLALRRFDRQPAWLLQGLAWHVEHELLDSHYCFPWRNEFVFAVEHSAWEANLKSWAKDVDDLAIEDVVGLTRGDFAIVHARSAWGAVSFLARHRPGALPALFEDLRKLREEKGVLHKEDGTWEKVPDWSPTATDQLALLEQHAGPEVLAQMLEFFKKGKSYKAPKAR